MKQTQPGFELLVSDCVSDYIREAGRLLALIEASDSGVEIPFPSAVAEIAKLLLGLGADQKVILVGNGGSAAIASEAANRLWKFCGLKAMTFNDPVLLSSTANDCGWERVFGEPIKVYGREGDILIAISSSGMSTNILFAVALARAKKFARIVTLSGFGFDNHLRGYGDFNFYVPSDSYRHVERTHLFILDCIHDLFLQVRAGQININGKELTNRGIG